jgi:hypothetical protein
MFVRQREGPAILGDATFTVRAPATVLSPPGVKHEAGVEDAGEPAWAGAVIVFC